MGCRRLASPAIATPANRISRTSQVLRILDSDHVFDARRFLNRIDQQGAQQSGCSIVRTIIFKKQGVANLQQAIITLVRFLTKPATSI